MPGTRQAGAPALETGTSRVKVFFGARRAVTFSFRVTDGAAAGLQVQLVRVADGSVVRTWAPAPPSPGAVASVVWNGDLPNRQAAPAGRYAFRLTASAGSGAVARSAQATNLTRDAFDLYQDQFPIRGAHKYGQGLGAGRGHQGQDVFAKCGTPLVAARGGKIKTKAYHGRAGNYLVIDGDGTGNDYAYMHMAAPSPFEKGDRVYTGQQIGQVGDTGRASGCHLHFEAWGAPGWYSGGRARRPDAAAEGLGRLLLTGCALVPLAHVADVQRSVDFYETLGFAVEERYERRAGCCGAGCAATPPS